MRPGFSFLLGSRLKLALGLLQRLWPCRLSAPSTFCVDTVRGEPRTWVTSVFVALTSISVFETDTRLSLTHLFGFEPVLMSQGILRRVLFCFFFPLLLA